MASIKKNLVYSIAHQMLLIIIPLVTIPYVSKALGTEGMGVYSYSYTLANYFVLFAMLGVKNYGNRSIAAVRHNPEKCSKIFWQIYGLQLLCSAACLTLYFLYIIFVENDFLIIGLIQGIYVLSAVLDITWYFFGIEQFKVTVIFHSVIKLSELILIFIFVNNRGDLWKYTLIMAAGTCLSQAYLWANMKHIKWIRPSLKDILGHLPSELLLFIPVLAVSLYKMMDKIMLGQIAQMSDVGSYEIVEKIISVPMGIITAIGTVMLPRMTVVLNTSESKGKMYIRNSMIFAMFMSIAISFGLASVAPQLIFLFWGDEFSLCAELLRAIVPTIVFISWANVIRTHYLIPQKKDKKYIASVVMGAIVNLTVNFMLIPKMGAMGAVIGTVCAEMCVCVTQTVMVRKELNIKRYFLETLAFPVFGMIMYKTVEAVGANKAYSIKLLILQIAAGAAVYLVLSGAYLLILRKLLNKKKEIKEENA